MEQSYLWLVTHIPEKYHVSQSEVIEPEETCGNERRQEVV